MGSLSLGATGARRQTHQRHVAGTGQLHPLHLVCNKAMNHAAWAEGLSGLEGMEGDAGGLGVAPNACMRCGRPAWFPHETSVGSRGTETPARGRASSALLHFTTTRPIIDLVGHRRGTQVNLIQRLAGMRAAAGLAAQPVAAARPLATRQQQRTPAAVQAAEQQRQQRPWQQQQRRRRPLPPAAAGGGDKRILAAGGDVGDEFEDMMDRREELLRQRDEEGDEGGLNADEDEELADLTARAPRCAVARGWPGTACSCSLWMREGRHAGSVLPSARLAPLPAPAQPAPPAAAAPQACCNLGTSRIQGRCLMKMMTRRHPPATMMWQPSTWRTRMRRLPRRRGPRCDEGLLV